MAAPLQKFESSWQKEIERKQLKEAREHYLEKVKADYDRREKKKEDARKRGEGTWMLPSVSDRIVNDEQKVKKSKLKKQKKEKKEKKKKKKKEKKEKKSKKRKKHSASDEDSSDSSNSDSEPEMEWVAKTTTTAAPTAGPKLERQDWMVDPMEAIFGGVTRDQIREQKKKESGLEEEEKKSVIEQVGQHERELNPYWRDGGKGMPQEEPGVKPAKAAKGAWSPGVAGDGGLGWIKQAYQRCQRAAQEEGRTLEDVAAERYGSLKKLEKMIAEAEKNYKKYMESQSRDRDRERVGGRQYSDRDRDRDRGGDSRPDSKSIRGSGYGGGGGGGVSRRFMNPDDSNRKRNIFMKPRDEMDSPREPQRRKLPFMKPGEDEGKGDGDRGGRLPPGGGWRKQDGRESQNAVPRWKKSKPESSRQEDRRSPDRGRDRSRDRRDMSRDRSGSRDRERDRSRDKIRDRSRDRKGDRSRSRSNDRKVGSRGIEDGESGSMDIGKDRSHNRSRSPSKDRHRHHSASSSSDSSSDSSKDSQSSDPQSESEPEPEPVRLLSEDELNALGARILKAEIMGNEDLATKLKTELEAARAARASFSSSSSAAAGPAGPADGVTGEGGRRSSAQKEGDDVVVLTRTDRAGNVRPLPAPRHERGEAGGRRHKKEKVSTHAKEGHRERYFADDDKHNLQDLVRQEKMSTAEDSNMMFARLAGRSIEKTDEEHQIDDVMVQRANKKMSDARMEERDRSAAIYEHRRMQGALNNCKFCFENIPKHLIIAIGLKVILCLPAHRSMVPGHCLIIPMQHTASATAVEDDVWTEIQVFRKGLTAMFREQEEDTVFMETSMHLKHHPHMVVEVVPMPVEVGEMAPIYFKKAIQESDTEWAQNKKLIDLSAKNIRNSVPKGFPYFSVDFGLQGGFAHVIEDEQIFPAYFGRSVCGGMMDVEPNLWRKPHKEDFELQRQKVLRFAAWWKPYDWTQKLKAEKDSDSE